MFMEPIPTPPIQTRVVSPMVRKYCAAPTRSIPATISRNRRNRPPNSDEDKDGLTYAREKSIGTDPTNPDTDQGVVKDGTEVLLEQNPLDSGDDNNFGGAASGSCGSGWCLHFRK